MQSIVDNRFSDTFTIDKLISEAKDDGVLVNDSDIDEIKNEDAQKLYEVGDVYYKNQAYYKAVTWLSWSAKHGNRDAQYKLGIIFESGLGVPMDRTAALRWYHKSALQGHASVLVNIEVLNDSGYSLKKVELEHLKLENEILAIVKRNDAKVKGLQANIEELKMLLTNEKNTVNELREKIHSLERDMQENKSDSDSERGNSSDKNRLLDGIEVVSQDKNGKHDD